MTLQLIGAGFGRTGTLSLKLAIEKLDAGRCYHMLEVAQNPGHVDLWQDAADGKPVDWDALFSGYAATVDWPGCRFWRELVARYPDAKVLLSLRDSDGWYESVLGTIYRSMTGEQPPNDIMRRHLTMARKIVLEDTFDGRFEDRTHAISVFDRHNDEVREAVPADRLLVHRPGDGWEPLCRFLERPVPDEPYPHVNSSADFQDRMESMRKAVQKEGAES